MKGVHTTFDLESDNWALESMFINGSRGANISDKSSYRQLQPLLIDVIEWCKNPTETKALIQGKLDLSLRVD